jgi:Na+-transporting NADH:ubiquinone oxidoreductase subunit NqrA
MKILIDTNEFLDERVRIEKTLMKRDFLDEFPEVLKWKLQMLYFDGDSWVQICRIDNYPHEGLVGSHIHIGRTIRRANLAFPEAYDKIIEIGRRLLRGKGHEL